MIDVRTHTGSHSVSKGSLEPVGTRKLPRIVGGPSDPVSEKPHRFGPPATPIGAAVASGKGPCTESVLICRFGPYFPFRFLFWRFGSYVVPFRFLNVTIWVLSSLRLSLRCCQLLSIVIINRVGNQLFFSLGPRVGFPFADWCFRIFSKKTCSTTRL